MNYHNITTEDMLNGSGLRVCLWLSGCDHQCEGCQNSQTWDPNSGIEFDENAMDELICALDKDYVSGITFTGGDPLYEENQSMVVAIMVYIINRYENKKNIWLYTGYTWEEIMDSPKLRAIIRLVDVLVEGRYEKDKLDVNYPWAGSTNQRVIDVKESIEKEEIVLWNA